MADEDDIDVDVEVDLDNEQSKPEPLWLADGEIVIVDPVAFAAATESVAFQARNGDLFLLKRASLKWVNVESESKQGGPTRFRIS